MLLYWIVLYSLLLGVSCQQQQQQQDDDDNNDSDAVADCSFISGEGCMNGICKYCGMCVPSYCILATPYSTGDNEGSTCAVTNQPYGYDFYNYCLSSGDDGYDDDDDDGYGGSDSGSCNTSTLCYPFRLGDTSIKHTWTSLTCSDSCQLIMKDGSPPPAPTPISNLTHINTTATPYHPTSGTTHTSGNRNPHINQFDPRSKSAASILLITACAVVSTLLLVWLVRILFYKTKYWPYINKYFCCGSCTPALQVSSSNSSASSNNSTLSSTRSRPPSFHSNIMRQSSQESLPSYHCQDQSLPKYEQAIVTQIRGMPFLDHHPSTSSSQQHQPIWIPIYLSSGNNNSTVVSSPIFNSFLPQHSDWARPNIRHMPLQRSSISSTVESEQEEEEEEEERQQRQ